MITDAMNFVSLPRFLPTYQWILKCLSQGKPVALNCLWASWGAVTLVNQETKWNGKMKTKWKLHPQNCKLAHPGTCLTSISYVVFFLSSSIVSQVIVYTICCLWYLERLRVTGLFSPVLGTACFAGKLQSVVYAPSHTQSGYIKLPREYIA